MDASGLAVRKLIVGLIALACLVTAVGLWVFAEDPEKNPVTAVTMRLGIMLGALWLALPNRGADLAWGKALPAVVAVIVVLAIIRVNWRVLVYAIPVAIVVGIVAAMIRPRSKRRTSGRPPPK